MLVNNLFLAEWSDEGAIDRLGKRDSRGLGSPIPNWMNFPIRIPSGSCSASQEAIMVKVSVMQSKRRAPRNGSPVEPASRVDVMPPTQPHNGSHGLGAFRGGAASARYGVRLSTSGPFPSKSRWRLETNDSRTPKSLP